MFGSANVVNPVIDGEKIDQKLGELLEIVSLIIATLIRELWFCSRAAMSLVEGLNLAACLVGRDDP